MAARRKILAQKHTAAEEPDDEPALRQFQEALDNARGSAYVRPAFWDAVPYDDSFFQDYDPTASLEDEDGEESEAEEEGDDDAPHYTCWLLGFSIFSSRKSHVAKRSNASVEWQRMYYMLWEEQQKRGTTLYSVTLDPASGVDDPHRVPYFLYTHQQQHVTAVVGMNTVRQASARGPHGTPPKTKDIEPGLMFRVTFANIPLIKGCPDVPHPLSRFWVHRDWLEVHPHTLALLDAYLKNPPPPPRYFSGVKKIKSHQTEDDGTLRFRVVFGDNTEVDDATLEEIEDAEREVGADNLYLKIYEYAHLNIFQKGWVPPQMRRPSPVQQPVVENNLLDSRSPSPAPANDSFDSQPVQRRTKRARCLSPGHSDEELPSVIIVPSIPALPPAPLGGAQVEVQPLVDHSGSMSRVEAQTPQSARSADDTLELEEHTPMFDMPLDDDDDVVALIPPSIGTLL
eukprot:m.130479 g.130479  ORF g.130479 m.130479 type:complete len:455 (+) comp9451_c1_seq1:2173-3537(+)